jgi:hypothetical protein
VVRSRHDFREPAAMRRVTLGIVLWAWLVALAAAGPALAVRGHAFSRAFPDLEEPGHVSLLLADVYRQGHEVSGLAVDESTHDVLVADTGNRRIDVFSASGSFVRAWGWGVATGAAELQVCTSACLSGLSGSSPGEFEKPLFVAVDNDPSSPSLGDVYVGDIGDHLVTKFDGEGHLISSWGNNGENASHEHVEPNGQLNGETVPSRNEFFFTFFGMAVDASGNLWVYDDNQNLFEFAQSGVFTSLCAVRNVGGPGAGMAVESGPPYLLDSFGHVRRVPEGKCTEPAEVTSGPHLANGLAFDPETKDLYVDAQGEFIEDFPAACVASGLNCVSGGVFGEEALSGGGASLGVDAQTGDVFVANAAAGQIDAFAVSIEAESSPASEIATGEATLRGSVNPFGTELTSCTFEYGATEAYGHVAPCEESLSSIGKGTADVEVQARVSGLVGGSGYHYRLHVSNATSSVNGADERFETVPLAHVLEVFAAEVTASTAVLTALVNPENVSNTAYQFEYGPCETFAKCATEPYPSKAPANEVPLGGNTPLKVTQAVSGLTAGVTYHFRIAVKGANGTSPSPEGTFVFQPPAPSCARARPQAGSDGLPDCRAYELVTPTQKNGALVYNALNPTPPAISDDGSRVLAITIQCFASPESCTAVRQAEGTLYAFERAAGGWTTRSLAPPASFTGISLISYRAGNLDALYGAPPAEAQPEEFWIRQLDGTLSAIGPIKELPGFAVANVGTSAPLVATSDFKHIAYNAGERLWSFEPPPAEASSNGIYEYPGVGGHPALTDVTGERGSTDMIGLCGATLGGQKQNRDVYNTMSSDGRSIIFDVAPCSGGSGKNSNVPVPAHTVYEREEHKDGTMATVKVSARGTPCGSQCQQSPAGDALYEGASEDGSRVFFTSTQRLTDEASEDSRSGESAYTSGCFETAADTSGCNLYLWTCPDHCENEAAQHLVDVSAGDSSGSGPQVQGVMAVSPDGSSVYFVAHGRLTGANQAGRSPTPGADNLYVYGPNAQGEARLAFIGTMARTDEAQWSRGVRYPNVTPDGRFLVFTSHRALTSDVTREEGPTQIYRYDAIAEELVRVSIGEQGFNDNGNAGVTGADATIQESYVGFKVGGRPDPTMSDDGRFVFFSSPVGLTPGALNDEHVIGNSKVLAQNVYEWEAPGTKVSEGAAACEEPEGCVWLISDGRDKTEGSLNHKNETAVQLLGSDATGRNVFFETMDQLVAGDQDAQIDFYDVRVDGGFPASSEHQCESLASCHQQPSSEEPTLEGPASSVFSGFGNFLAGTEQHRPETHLTPAQVLARALSACRRKPAGGSRRACEAAARSTYRAHLLAAALASCRRKHAGRARHICERAARRRYTARSAATRAPERKR